MTQWTTPEAKSLSRADIEQVKSVFDGETPPVITPPPGFQLLGAEGDIGGGWHRNNDGKWQIYAYRIVRMRNEEERA